ncbi:hypothetical protein PINS_up015447 [Pythium insidiosum]|nr:hypothetical protein PINS_up015447 [Pythium insidiosum]
MSYLANARVSQQAGRKQHNRGWKHRENVKLYYEQFLTGQGVAMTRTLLTKTLKHAYI